MAVTKFDICTRALQRTGASSIDSFDDETTESNVAGREYPLLVETLLSEYRWNFATKRVALGHIAEVPPVGWSDYWQMPADLLVLRGVFLPAGSPIEYQIDQDKIACNYDENHILYAVYTASFEEAYWPSYFTELVTEALEVVFWNAIARNPGQANEARKHLEAITKPIARALDGQQRTARQFPPSRLNSIRRI